MLFVVLLLKMNWEDSSIEKLIQNFCFQFHLVRKTGTRKLVPVLWYHFSAPISGACVFGITYYILRVLCIARAQNVPMNFESEELELEYTT